MKKLSVITLVIMLPVIPSILFISQEHVMAQLLLFSQLLVVWGVLPFFFRTQKPGVKDWSLRSKILTAFMIVILVLPFLYVLGERGSLQTTEILQSSLRMFSETSESFLILGVCLATFFVIGVLLKRRGSLA